jgi:hypothetical protein
MPSAAKRTAIGYLTLAFLRPHARVCFWFRESRAFYAAIERSGYSSSLRRHFGPCRFFYAARSSQQFRDSAHRILRRHCVARRTGHLANEQPKSCELRRLADLASVDLVSVKPFWALRRRQRPLCNGRRYTVPRVGRWFRSIWKSG